MPAKKPKSDEKPQSERFIEIAREIGADESLESFEIALDKILLPGKIYAPITHTDGQNGNSEK